jgi:hypothetical protein
LIKTKFYTGNDTVERSYSIDYEGQILVLPVSSFGEQYQKPQYQLFRANGGFRVCSPEKLGYRSIRTLHYMMVKSVDTVEVISSEYLNRSWLQS